MEYRTLLVDSSYFAYRVYFSSKLLPLAYGFLTGLADLSKRYSVDTLIVVLDSGHEAKDRVYDQYKKKRKHLPEEQQRDFNAQMVLLDEFLLHLGIKSCSAQGAEADDVIAHLVLNGNAKVEEQDRSFRTVYAPKPILVLSGDHDLYPLLSSEVAMWRVRGNTPYTAGDFEKEFSLRPPQYKDMLALMGCSSDNVPGVKGIGPKYASYLIKKYSTIEGIKGASDGDPVAQRVLSSWDAVELSLRLVSYEQVDPIIKVSEPNLSKIRKLLFALGLTPLITDWPDLVDLSRL